MKRLFIALPAAILMTFFVFGFMTWLVNMGKTPLPDQKPTVRFDMLQVEQDSQTQRRQRQLPEPPEQPAQPPETQVSNSSNLSENSISLDSLDLPQVALDTAVTGLAISNPGPMKIAQNQQVMPLHRMEPRYPARALSRKIEGYVVMSFTINEVGNPINIEVVQSEPSRVFDREATRALQRWKYQPLVVNGKATPREGQTVKLEFKLQ
ncbi:energy transducer TonB [Vibrio breoganii]|uniref:Protein TonB n=1 Tax=Vibrio breoganii TaxID=553239 RepID=A0ABX1UA19_9VIBR|nr:energy transducer TonB [Vibrio breoganii]NMO74643.1 energy transducer TonB [Vibrio breoganii]NMR71308.1 energy transducer TonB [Vibrio breoganii]PMG01477.1 energy transducer TonB [Vibrio breoganii]PMG01708.1 energy transducer TonB [Vibrio breoganii]PMG83006.1 energy transducer TonB [Vibrio breoganii]